MPQRIFVRFKREDVLHYPIGGKVYGDDFRAALGDLLRCGVEILNTPIIDACKRVKRDQIRR